ncbi:hypothetical protein SDC9_173739 [bioreactor metagenome]|uniref:Uncharacterized protein n=1 Tax=bioreactor metagenome TaxID=1076179 RepID=A0A645GI03_9ZZZZ
MRACRQQQPVIGFLRIVGQPNLSRAAVDCRGGDAEFDGNTLLAVKFGAFDEELFCREIA